MHIEEIGLDVLASLFYGTSVFTPILEAKISGLKSSTTVQTRRTNANCSQLKIETQNATCQPLFLRQTRSSAYSDRLVHLSKFSEWLAKQKIRSYPQS